MRRLCSSGDIIGSEALIDGLSPPFGCSAKMVEHVGLYLHTVQHILRNFVRGRSDSNLSSTSALRRNTGGSQSPFSPHPTPPWES